MGLGVLTAAIAFLMFNRVYVNGVKVLLWRRSFDHLTAKRRTLKDYPLLDMDSETHSTAVQPDTTQAR